MDNYRSTSKDTAEECAYKIKGQSAMNMFAYDCSMDLVQVAGRYRPLIIIVMCIFYKWKREGGGNSIITIVHINCLKLVTADVQIVSCYRSHRDV